MGMGLGLLFFTEVVGSIVHFHLPTYILFGHFGGVKTGGCSD